jgi:hypothetical protein
LGLPQSRNANCIFVVVDKFTKYAHFLPLKHPFIAASVAKLFLDNVYKLHGLPLSIVSDREFSPAKFGKNCLVWLSCS